MKLNEMKIKTDYIDIFDVLAFLSKEEKENIHLEYDSDYDVTYCNLNTSEDPINIPELQLNGVKNGVYKLCANYLYFGSFVVLNNELYEIISRDWITYN